MSKIFNSNLAKVLGSIKYDWVVSCNCGIQYLEILNSKREPMYMIWADGICYNTKSGGDVPQWVFKVREEIVI